MTNTEREELIARMTVEEKAALCSGFDYWHTKTIDRLGVPARMMADSPNGLRKQDDKADHLGINESIKAVCFPSGCAAACSFDRQLLFELGAVLGRECRAEGVAVLLGPAVNSKRSPLCGRNFEYLSEDPLLAGELGAAQVRGLQSEGVSACVKHYLANNQEHRRMSVSAQMDERTLREIYLAPFERMVKTAKPWAVMSSYNRVGGELVAESRRFLTEVLRKEWGFDGCVVSDWGGTADRIRCLSAGMDLEMPTSHGINDRRLVAAVANGALEESTLNTAVDRILTLLGRTDAAGRTPCVFDYAADHDFARRAAEASAVLLKNNGVLPLRPAARIAFIGAYAQKPRYQGGGSGHINAYRAVGAYEAAVAAGYDVTFAQGYRDGDEQPDDALASQAAASAARADAAVLFVGLPEVYESEGFDRAHMRMPENQNRLIAQIAAVQPNTVVVLHNGAPVEMPWADDVAAILETYLSGEAVGEASVNLLYGVANPSGRLAESVPYRLEDNPSYLFFPGEGDRVDYREGIFVGYRYYARKKQPVRYPFGFGLSYTTFAYRHLRAEAQHMGCADTLALSVEVSNTGHRDGSEVVQLYVEAPGRRVSCPVRELRDFAKVFLRAGETRRVDFTLPPRAFSYFDEELNGWCVEGGEYTIAVGRSAEEMLLRCTVTVDGTIRPVPVCSLDSTLGDLAEDVRTRDVVLPLMERYRESLHKTECEGETSREAVSVQMVEAMVRYMPLRSLVSLGGFPVTREELLEIVDRVNAIRERESV